MSSPTLTLIGGDNGTLIPTPSGTLSFTLGEMYFAIFQAQPSCANTPTISDTLSNTWIPIATWDSGAAWYCIANSTNSTVVTADCAGNVGNLGSYALAVSHASGVVANGINASFSFGTGTVANGALGVWSAQNYPIISPANASHSIPWFMLMVSFSGTDSNPLVVMFITTTDHNNYLINGATGFWAVSGFGSLPCISSFSYQFPIVSSPVSSADDVISDLCIRAGLAANQIDVSMLTDANVFGGSATVTGYVLSGQTTAADALRALMQMYLLDAAEINGKITFVPRGRAPVLTIPEAELGLMSEKAKVKPESFKQSQDLPYLMDITYSDIALNYQQNRQEVMRNSRVVTTRQRQTMSLPLVMTSQQAIQIADAWLFIAWLERQGFTFSLASPRFMQLDPTDVIQFVYEGITFQIRVSEMHIGAGFASSISGPNNQQKGFQTSKLTGTQSISVLSNGSSGSGTGGGTSVTPVNSIPLTSLFLFDIPLPSDSDANPGGSGFYFAMGSSQAGWTTGTLLDSLDNSDFVAISSSSQNVTFGSAVNALGAPPITWDFDNTNVLNVSIVNGTPSGVSLNSLLGGANFFVVGQEIIAAMNVVQNDDGTYALSGLLRGLRGTEKYCGTHAAGEIVVQIATGLTHYPDVLGSIGVLRYFKGVTTGADPTQVTAQQFTLGGADLKPYAPMGVGGTADSSGNIIITWNRRTRIGGEADWGDGVGTVPLSEDSEAYEVDILNGSTVVRTITGLTTTTAVYTVAQQVTDFGSQQAAVVANVYQISAQVGRGSAGNGTIPTPGGWPIPWPAVYPAGGLFYVNGS